MASSDITTFDSTTEEWRDVPGYEGLYQASNLGRILSLPRNQLVHGRKSSVIRKTFLTGKGKYPAIDLCKNNERQRFYIHELIARVFVGERPAGYEVNHIDLNKYNNCAENLEYITHAQNVQHCVDRGGHPHGETHGSALLTLEQVNYIRQNYKFRDPYYSAKAISERLGVSDTAVRCVLLGRSWKSAE